MFHLIVDGEKAQGVPFLRISYESVYPCCSMLESNLPRIEIDRLVRVARSAKPTCPFDSFV